MKQPLSFFPKRAQGGFTLVETLVAVMILAFAIIGPFVLSAQSLRASRDARSELSATYLALEGIEIVHNIRDNNSGDDITASHTNWMNNIIATCKANGCVPDITQQMTPAALIMCPPGLCPNRSTVYYNPTTGLYRQSDVALSSPWQKTTYTRILSVVGVDDPNDPQKQVRITSTVTYLGYGHKTRTLSIVDDFYNWFPSLN
jgi:prepilin-type N-terminal cleavage/methylation domain-containing protein